MHANTHWRALKARSKPGQRCHQDSRGNFLKWKCSILIGRIFKWKITVMARSIALTTPLFEPKTRSSLLQWVYNYLLDLNHLCSNFLKSHTCTLKKFSAFSPSSDPHPPGIRNYLFCITISGFRVSKFLFYGSKPVQPCAAWPLHPSVELRVFHSGKRKSWPDPTVWIFSFYYTFDHRDPYLIFIHTVWYWKFIWKIMENLT